MLRESAASRHPFASAIAVALSLLVAPVAFAADAPSGPIASLVAMTRTALVNAGLTEKTIETSKGKLAWFEGGAGPTVVLLHGANDQAGSWAAAAKALVGAYRLVIPDLPGHGDSDPATGALTCDLFRSGVGAIIDAVAPDEKVILVGNSLGGWLAALYALDHPDRVAGLVLEDAGALRVDPAHRVNLVPKDRDEARAIMTKVEGPAAAFIPDAILDDLVATIQGSPLTRMDGASFEKCLLDGRLGEIHAPTVVLWGSIDGVLPLEYGRRIHAAIPGSSLVVLDGCGHSPHLHCAGVMVPKLVDALDGMRKEEDQKLRRSGHHAAR